MQGALQARLNETGLTAGQRMHTIVATVVPAAHVQAMSKLTLENSYKDDCELLL
jgi:hypothetical protein